MSDAEAILSARSWFVFDVLRSKVIGVVKSRHADKVSFILFVANVSLSTSFTVERGGNGNLQMSWC